MAGTALHGQPQDVALRGAGEPGHVAHARLQGADACACNARTGAVSTCSSAWTAVVCARSELVGGAVRMEGVPRCPSQTNLPASRCDAWHTLGLGARNATKVTASAARHHVCGLWTLLPAAFIIAYHMTFVGLSSRSAVPVGTWKEGDSCVRGAPTAYLGPHTCCSPLRCVPCPEQIIALTHLLPIWARIRALRRCVVCHALEKIIALTLLPLAMLVSKGHRVSILNPLVLKARQDSTPRAAAVHAGPPQRTTPSGSTTHVGAWLPSWLQLYGFHAWLWDCASAVSCELFADGSL